MRTYTKMSDLIEYIRENPGLTTKRIKIHFGINTYNSSNHFLVKAKSMGLIRTEKIKGDRELRYFVED